MRGGKISQWGFPFYGLILTPEDKLRIHEQIGLLYYNSNGGITHDEAYSMTIALRNFNIRWIIHQKELEKKANEKAQDHSSNTTTPKSPPRVLPRKSPPK